MTTARADTRPQLDASSVFVLAFIGVFAYLDWITHRSLIETILLVGIATGAYLYRRTIIERLGMQEQVAAISPGWRTILMAVPGFAYFMARGQGTSGAGGIVLIGMALVVGVSAVFGPRLDLRLAAFYATRNRVAPRWLRRALALIVPILVAFLIIHGSLADLPAMFGGTTKHPATPDGRDWRFLLGTLLSAAVAWLLLREAPSSAPAPGATGPAPGGAGSATAGAATTLPGPAGPGTALQPTHVVPAGGLDAWRAPGTGPAAAHLDAGVPITVVERRGDWARVVAANGWSGWVDGRRLQEGR